MSSTTGQYASGASPKYLLSAHQQELLFAALNSNSVPDMNSQIQPDAHALASSDSLSLQAPGSATLNGLDESPFIDYNYDQDPNFDFDFSNFSQDQMIGELPGGSSDGDGDGHEKRSHPDDDDDDEEGGGKRRESDGKGGKKPGRKALTSEPTSKRKAQNRAAQRAFRERKERHLKDLEDKVQDLEKASESANHENAMLRAKVEQMATELKEYRKKLATTRPSPAAAVPSSYLSGNGLSGSTNNPNDVNFQFEFPQFGKLPGPPVTDVSALMNAKTSPPQAHRSSTGGSISPLDQPHVGSGFGSYSSNMGILPNHPLAGADMSQFSGLFSPSLLESVSKDMAFDPATVNSFASRSSSESVRHNSTGRNTTYSSPSESSNSAANHGPSSSCGTSPEPSDNLGNKLSEKQLGAIGEEIASTPGTLNKTGFTPGFEINNFDWFAQQNGNQFDPQLFGDYREPQNNILAGNGLYDDSFFNEALNMDQFGSPFPADAKSPLPPHKDLVAQIDDKLSADEIVPVEYKSQMLTCNSMWEKLQNCPSVQKGEIDMDDLCTQLQQKAKCSGQGPVIDEKDFKSVIRSMFPADKPCPSAK